MVRKNPENLCCRVIPTCVGKAGPPAGRFVPPAGHPHVCGQSRRASLNSSLAFGSSPRVWGKLRRSLEGPCIPRVIPTCVGKAGQEACMCSRPTGHPHVCGESDVNAVQSMADSGSSPRVWGKPSPRVWGKPSACLVVVSSIAGHPHVCGESPPAGSRSVGRSGSSPRVWGKLVHGDPRHEPVRVIPTCVGKALGFEGRGP